MCTLVRVVNITVVVGGQFADFGPSGSGYYEYASYVYAYGEGSFIDENVAYTYGSGDQNYVFDVGSFIVGSGGVLWLLW